MKCPICGSELLTKQTAKGTAYQMCPRWRECKTFASPEVMNLVAAIYAENDRLRKQLEEALEQNDSLFHQADDAIRTGAILATQLEESRRTLKMFSNGKVTE